MVFKFSTAFFLMPLAGIILLLPGCKQQAYNPKSIQEISPHTSSAQSKNHITVSCKPLTKSETHGLFDGRGSRLLHKRRSIHPLFLSVENNTLIPLSLDPGNIGLKLINPELVAQRLYSHTSRRVVTPLILGTLGAGFTFYAAACISIIGAIATIPALIKVGYAGLGLSGAFALSAPIFSYQQGHYASQLNARIYQDVMSKSLHMPVIIESGQCYNALLFVPHRAYNTSFGMKLVDASAAQSLGYEIRVVEGEISCLES